MLNTGGGSMANAFLVVNGRSISVNIPNAFSLRIGKSLWTTGGATGRAAGAPGCAESIVESGAPLHASACHGTQHRRATGAPGSPLCEQSRASSILAACAIGVLGLE
jgi:hypothetical protein